MPYPSIKKSLPSLKEIFQNLKYDKKGEPITSEMERDKKADGGIADLLKI